MSDVKVKLEATCDRTGKTDNLEVTLSEATKFQTIRDQKAQSANAIRTDLAKISEDKMPDLIVAYRGQVVVLGNVNPKSDGALARLLHEVTKDEDIFPKPVATKRKSKDTTVEEGTSSSDSSNGERPAPQARA